MAPGSEWPEEPALLIDGVDILVTGCHIRWSNPCVMISANGGFAEFHNTHIFSNWVDNDVPPRAIVAKRGAFASAFHGCYIDTGYVDVYSDNIDFYNCQFMANDTMNGVAPCFIRAFASSVGQSSSTFIVKNPRR